MSGDAKLDILRRIATALSKRPPEDTARNASEWEQLPRAYQTAPSLPPEAKLDLLIDRLRDYATEVVRVPDSQVSRAIDEILTARGAHPTLLPQGFPAHWQPASTSLIPDTGFSTRELDQFDGVLTGATVAIAQTGTLVLQHGEGQGRRAGTLVPDFHLCVVRVRDVVETVPEAFARLDAHSALPLTLISGPSATADIEMTRIKGVHGPRFLHVLLVDD